MDYEATLNFLIDTRDLLEDVATDEHEDAEVVAEYISKIKILNQVIELVRHQRDEQDDADDEAWNNALADEGPVDE